MSNRQAKRALQRLKCSALVEEFLLPGEDLKEFCEFCEQIFLEYRPCGPSEEACALTIAKPLWRKLRPHPSARTKPDDASELEDHPMHDSVIAWRLPPQYHGGRAPPEVIAKIDRELREQYKKEREERQRNNPTLDLNTIHTDHEHTVELDRQFSDALKQMVKLKQMKRRAR